ncbi:MAG TPA: 2Fe-2S iron-sulfur cluster-binding protein [Candidatus Bilamarchaeaceae archaeon]|nr:2Fe-2S iron-sulfur cluster-binding protein [Candidatus Bilamarchaeaceae archaeon]
MATVIIKNDGDLALEVANGTCLEQLEGKCTVLFACKTASCGSCLVRVVEGAENLEPPNDQEKLGLEAFGTMPTQRLCCQAKIKQDTVKLEY